MKHIAVAAHQGVVSGGYILGNTLDAFDIALKDGAEIIELDATLCADGTVYTFHPGTEPAHLGIEKNALGRMTSEEIAPLRRIFPDGHKSPWPLYTLEESLDHLKNRCLINVDKSWTCLPEIVKAVNRVGVGEQVIFKSNIRGDNWMNELRAEEEIAPRFRYMPVFYENDIASEIVEKMNINFYGAEICFKTEDSELASDSFIEKMHKKGVKLWVNSIVFNYKTVLSAGHNDNVSLLDPDAGWGWLAGKGYDIIQTDWVLHCRQYLNSLAY
ncbi:MAG: glycerophosphodiester phosphodiesterase family protein [Clostridia bacterium]|nr:glycerophosphodiester phosphodiesterase family protein [Clostridia bacterium]